MSRANLIVVGAGSAGCVLAARLAGEFGIRVTLLEPPSAESPAIDRLRPARWLNQLGSADDWSFTTEPSDRLAARCLTWPRGRGLGGSSRINAMIWFPPTPADMRAMHTAAGGKWRIDEMQAAFRAVESMVRPEPPRWLSEPSRHFLDAVQAIAGATPMVFRRLCRRGERWLPSELLPADKAQVEIVRGVADHILWENDRAVGVHVRDQHGSYDLRASHGVALSAGTIATPMILMRSGIGTRDELARHDIAFRTECPSLGDHLRDHLIMPVVFERSSADRPFRAQATMQDLARWQVMGAGPIASNLAECGGLFEDQSIQVHVTPTHYLTYPQQDAVPSMTIGVNSTQPRSTGRVCLRSKQAGDVPLISPPYLHQEQDLKETMRGIRLARQIAAQSPLAESIRGESIPGTRRASDDELARAISRYAQTLYHPVGTCRMGEGADAAIDHGFALRGADRLWVVDASVLPQLTVGNPSASVMSLAWMAAERIAFRL